MAEAATGISSDRLVFVGGLHRSGTSLLHRCIGDHPAASVFRDTGVPEDEGQHLQAVYPPAAAHGGPGRFGFDPAAHLTERSPLATPEHAERLLAEWAPHWNLGRDCLVEKSPPNLIRLRFLQALFPEARFVVMLRHPVAVAYATQKWSKTSLDSLVRHWLVCHERFEADRPHVRQLLMLRYEDFTADPEAELRRAHDFLGLAPQPLQREVRADVNAAYLARWWRLNERLLTRPYARRIRRRYEGRAHGFGYSLDPDTAFG